MTAPVTASRLRAADALAVATAGVRSRRTRALLTAGGVAIGIAAMVAVLGVSAASRAHLLATLDELGTDLLTVQPGQSFLGEETALPPAAAAATRRLDTVDEAAAVALLEATVRRTDVIPSSRTAGIAVVAVEDGLLATLEGELAAGVFFDRASSAHPAVVLGATAARRLGITDLAGQPKVWLGGQWFAVVGILEPLPLAPELDTAALVGWEAAEEVLGEDATPTSLYVRTQREAVDAVRALLPRTTNPAAPEAVEVSRPSDALEARAAADSAFTALLLGLGGVALLVGGVGIANVMIVAVLERRGEIGVRRALGATRRHIGAQFVVEAVMLAGAGGLGGVAAGTLITFGYAGYRGWPFAMPLTGLLAAAGVAVLVGGVAGLYPASRAARLQPADAVRPR